jgi:hypothetical protein
MKTVSEVIAALQAIVEVTPEAADYIVGTVSDENLEIRVVAHVFGPAVVFVNFPDPVVLLGVGIEKWHETQ